jgi:membrane protein DedA with SNARE-associated domain
MKGFIIGFILSGFSTLVVFAPLGIHIVTSGGVRGQTPFPSLDLLPMLATSIIFGVLLITLSYVFCKRGVERLLSSS